MQSQKQQTMKAIKITYWITTVLVAFSLLSAGIMYFTSADMPAAFAYLGFPDYFRKELGIAKIIGALVLVIPMLTRTVMDWAYEGTWMGFSSSAWGHTSLTAGYSGGILLGVRTHESNAGCCGSCPILVAWKSNTTNPEIRARSIWKRTDSALQK